MRAFTRHGFPDDVIGLAISWYVCYRRSYADVVAWFTARGRNIHRRLDLALGAMRAPTVWKSRAGAPTTSGSNVAGGCMGCPLQWDVDLGRARN
jgi:hypothetical protein